MKRLISGFIGLLLAGVALNAAAAPVLCADATRNHMFIDSSQVSACLAAGSGNLTGNPDNDLFLNSAAGAGYHPDGKSDEGPNPFSLDFTQLNGTGTWSFDASFWDTHSAGAIGFKFGTGNQPDEWFVYQLVAGVSSGDWTFVNVFGRGGGLSHLNLYGIDGDTTQVPEPGTLALLGVGLLGLGLARRRLAR